MKREQNGKCLKVIVHTTVQIGSFRTKASKNIIYLFSMNFNSILTSIPSKCQEFTLLYEYQKNVFANCDLFKPI